MFFQLLFLAMQTALPFFTDSTVLAPEHNQLYPFHNLKSDKPFVVLVEGDGNSDIDCYILVNKRIVQKDENNTDKCALATYPTTGEATVWIMNNGKNNDRYVVKVFER